MPVIQAPVTAHLRRAGAPRRRDAPFETQIRIGLHRGASQAWRFGGEDAGPKNEASNESGLAEQAAERNGFHRLDSLHGAFRVQARSPPLDDDNSGRNMASAKSSKVRRAAEALLGNNRHSAGDAQPMSGIIICLLIF
jgi:hypothetical protein